MRSSTRLDSAVFQLTPTRTRCDLVIFANGKTEKIASGLVNPFLAHLKAAQDQMAKGGYSIILEPDPESDATWFTKDAVERFVRFVSTPEVMERVYTLESEILQIEEAIAFQNNNDTGMNTVEGHQAKPVERNEGSRPESDSNEEKAIVLYKPGAHPPEENESSKQEGNSKVQLLRVLETRKTMLQKEQGMAFARAVAAGFDIDHMAPLVSFAECFGAMRLLDACKKFMELWKSKHETGQWLEIEAAEALSGRSDLSAVNASGIMFSNMVNKDKDSRPELQNGFNPENNGEASIDTSIDVKTPTVHPPPPPPPGHQEYFHGQFPHHMFPPWPIHSPTGAPPVYPAYPMQGMPYYQNYPGSSPYFQPPYPSVDDPRLNAGQRMWQQKQFMDTRDNNTESENWEGDASETRLELETKDSQSRESQKKSSRSVKKKSGMVVIRNINYITPKRHNSSGSESQTDSESKSEEDEDLQTSTPVTTKKNFVRSSKRKESLTKPMDALNSTDMEETAYGKEAEAGHWQAFQNILLRDADEDKRSIDQHMSMEKEVRRRHKTVGNDPLVFSERDMGETQVGKTTDIHNVNGTATYVRRASQDELLLSHMKARLDDGRSNNGKMDAQSAQIEGRRGGYRRTVNDDFIIHRQENQSDPSDPLAVNRFEHASSNLDNSSAQNLDDDSYIVPFRSNGVYERSAIDIESEFASKNQKAENLSSGVGSQVNYEPNNISWLPERGVEKGSIGFDPALDYEMLVRAENGASLDKKSKEAVNASKQGLNKADKDRKSKAISDTSDKKRSVGSIRKGKPSKLSPLEEARARAEKLRTYKADLQRMKKEKEEEDIKRLEDLKIERQKRIAARGNSVPSQSALTSKQTRKPLPTKLSPGSHKASKFSDSEPGPLSPLQRFPIKTASIGSSDSQKASKPGKSNSGIYSAGHRLSHSVSSLPEPKKDDSCITPDAKVSMARIRRLSEPKMSIGHPVSSGKSQGAEPISKRKISNGPESKKISAIMNLDRSKAASLPELKIKTSKRPDVAQSKSTTTEITHKTNGNKSSRILEGAELKTNDDRISNHKDGGENPLIEKTVLMLQCEKHPDTSVNITKDTLSLERGTNDIYGIGGKSEAVLDYAAIRAPVSPLTMNGVERAPSAFQLQEQPYSSEVMTVNAEKKSPKIPEKPYQAPYARVSSLEDPSAGKSEYGKAPPTDLQTVGTNAETGKVHVCDSENLKLEKTPESSEKPQSKESSKGFRRLLKFGRKNHSSSTGEHDAESDNASANGAEADDSLTNNVTEVHTLKNLISQDETPTAITTTQKSSRHFSLLSPFRSKTGEKKQTM